MRVPAGGMHGLQPLLPLAHCFSNAYSLDFPHCSLLPELGSARYIPTVVIPPAILHKSLDEPCNAPTYARYAASSAAVQDVTGGGLVSPTNQPVLVGRLVG